jgi:hypothetical protein
MTKRPGPARWMRYAFGGSLPPEFDEWVLHDTTARTWVLRHLVRALVQISPLVLVILLFLPGPVWIRVVGVVAATAMALLFSLAYMAETTDRRLTKAGYPSGTAEAIHSKRGSAARTEGTRRRQQKAADRRTRRRARAAV